MNMSPCKVLDVPVTSSFGFFRGVVQQKVGQQLIDAGLYSNSYEVVNQCFGCTLPGLGEDDLWRISGSSWFTLCKVSRSLELFSVS